MRIPLFLLLSLLAADALAQEILTAQPKASSTLTADGITFKAAHLTDGRLTTWWSPVTSTSPHTLTYTWLNAPAQVGAIQIHAGSHYPNYPSLGNLYPLNPRLKSLKVGTTPQDMKVYPLKDVDAIQTVVLTQPLVTKQLVIQIDPTEVYPGTKWQDISISHLALLAPMPSYLPPPVVWQDATPSQPADLEGVYMRRENWFRELIVEKRPGGTLVMNPWSECCDQACNPVSITALQGKADARQVVPGPEASQQNPELCGQGVYLVPEAVRVWAGPLPGPTAEAARQFEKAVENHARATLTGFYTWEEQGTWVLLGAHHIQFSGSQPVPYELVPIVTPGMNGIVGYIGWGGKKYSMEYSPAVAGPYPRFVLFEVKDYGQEPEDGTSPAYQLVGPER